MTKRQKFSRCLRRADRIVRSYRSEAPTGCDPQNTWVAVGVGVATTVGTLAYNAYQQGQANDAINAANDAAQKKFKKIDFNKVNQSAVVADAEGYNRADTNWASRFPQLKSARDAEMGDVVSDMTSTTPNSVVTRGLDTAGLGAESAKLGGNAYQQSRALGLGTTAMRDRSRTFFSTLLSPNPQRTFGLSGKDAANIAMANTNSQNILAGAIQGSNINAYNSAIAQQGQYNNLALGTLSSVLSNLYRPNPNQLQSGTFGSLPPGG